MKLLISICARGGSKGIPGKNIRELNGKPLIAYTIELAYKIKEYYKLSAIELSTDSEDIRCIAEQFGLRSSYIRPIALSGDSVGKIETINDLLLHSEMKHDTKYDYVLDLDVTSPLRNLNDIITAFKIIEDNKDSINLFSVSPASRSPYFNMVEKQSNGFFSEIKKTENHLFTRQSSPVVYDMNASFYIYKRGFFDLNYKGAITEKSLVYVVPHVCFDLDNELDFDYIEFLIENKKLDFEL